MSLSTKPCRTAPRPLMRLLIPSVFRTSPKPHVIGPPSNPPSCARPPALLRRPGSPPFKAASEYLTFQKVIDRDFAYPGDYPPAARDLTEKLLAAEPSARIGAFRKRGLELAALRLPVMAFGVLLRGLDARQSVELCERCKRV